MTLYITKNGQRLGPYSLDEAQRLVAAGTVQANDWAWYEGLTDWIPLQQVPGFLSPAATGVPGAVPPPAQRPVLVWVICLFMFICMPFSLLGLVFIHLLATGAFPVPEAQRHYFESQTAFDYAILILNNVVVLVWAIMLFMLRRVSLYIYIGALGLGVIMLIYNIVAHDWLSVVGIPGLIGAAFGWVLNLAILYYNWHLFRKGVLR